MQIQSLRVLAPARQKCPAFTLVKMTGSYPSQVRTKFIVSIQKPSAYAKPLPAAPASVQPVPGMRNIWEGLGMSRRLEKTLTMKVKFCADLRSMARVRPCHFKELRLPPVH